MVARGQLGVAGAGTSKLPQPRVKLSRGPSWEAREVGAPEDVSTGGGGSTKNVGRLPPGFGCGF